MNQALKSNIRKIWTENVPPAILATVGSSRLEAFLDQLVQVYKDHKYQIGNFDSWAYDNFTRTVRQRWGFRINHWG